MHEHRSACHVTRLQPCGFRDLNFVDFRAIGFQANQRIEFLQFADSGEHLMWIGKEEGH